MEAIVQHVSDENKKWVSNLKPEDMAKILDALALVPQYISDTESITEKTNVNKIPPEKVSELPANVGLQGEMEFEDIIQQFMPSDYKLMNTAKTGKCGDFIIEYTSNKTTKRYSLLIDVKYYKTTVPSKEIDKFNRDLTLNSNISGGLFLSLNSKIVGISQMIKFQEIFVNNNNIPIVFVRSKQPEIICEIIKFIFHINEIKDVNKNEVINKSELINTINELSNEVQLITSCRDNLQISKMEMEKTLNQMLFNLMQCEYNIGAKIKQINKSLADDLLINTCDNPDNENNPNLINVDLKTIINTFKNSIDVEYDALIYSIYNINWHKTIINIPKKQWILYKDAESIYTYIKFNKKFMDMIFPIQNEKFILEIEMDKVKNKIDKGKMKSDGYHIAINPDNISLILQLCNLI